MKKALIILSLLAALCVVVPVQAQEDSGAFFNVLRSELDERAAEEDAMLHPSAIRSNVQPAIGSSVSLDGAQPIRSSNAVYAAYDAGRDEASGWVTAIALLLAAFVIVFVIIIAITSTHEHDLD